jgi:N-acetylmuramoyl-L-alanine amidase
MLLAVALLFSAPAEKHLSIYSTAANYSLPIVQRQGRQYVGLLELLDPLGTVSAKAEGSHWKINYNNIPAEFTVNKSRGRVQGREADLAGKFILENGRGLVPVESLSSLLPRFLGGPATLQEDSERLFIGGVATHFTASVAAGDAAQLIFHFSNAVNPTIATEPGKLRMTFTREPVTAPASPTLTFASKVIPSATYSEANGAATITVNANAPLLANFSGDGRTITLAPARVQATAGNASGAASLAAPAASGGAAPRRYFAVIDASHGGADRGEALSPTLAEKDITLALARQLRQELESRGMPTLVLRDSDANISPDERAVLANTAHAAVYVALHAASSGHGVRLYTAMLPFAAGEDRGPFRRWEMAQTAWAGLSQTASASLSETLKKIQVPVRTLRAPLRPLNNMTTAAIAVEVAPPGDDVSALSSPDYQQLIAGAVANGILAVRPQLAAAP